MTYTNWDLGEPNNFGGNEHCTEILPRDGRFSWNDFPCAGEKLFICEYHTNSRQVGASNITLDEVQTEVPRSID